MLVKLINTGFIKLFNMSWVNDLIILTLIISTILININTCNLILLGLLFTKRGNIYKSA